MKGREVIDQKVNSIKCPDLQRCVVELPGHASSVSPWENH